MSSLTVANGDVATVVTYLEMVEPPPPSDAHSSLQLTRVRNPGLNHYRTLFRKVGTPWLWFSRLVMDDAQLESIILDPGVELYEVAAVEAVVGRLELDFRQAGESEIAFMGLVPSLAGEGHGRWLLAEALRLAWRDDIRRVHVHTCTLDHPAALKAYRRAGFIAFEREIERFPDPRLKGILPLDCAPHVPVLGTLASAVPAS